MNATARNLTQDDLARFTDIALEVILGHGVSRPSVEVELALWDALNQAHRREYRMAKWLRLTGSRTPSQEEVGAALVRAAFGVALDSGVAPAELLELELDLLFALQSVEVGEEARQVLAA